ncbi:hypothetical protein JL721_12572 [Aureococcus anophagefferens]|nr:hypothetical protein JL721_12572 [Aureococcus anophagefferens]
MWRLLLVAPLARSASLCDKLAGAPGLSEICAAPAEACVAAFGGRPRASCDDVCGAAGLACHGAFDDLNDDGRCPAGEPRSQRSWPAAPAHVKARAPDAPGQRMRVRAYSARVCDDGASFNVTVKIYPGGPPAKRGTSAFMGALPPGPNSNLQPDFNILYRDHFRALLAAHPGRLRIRYYLSRAAADAEDVCVDGEETVPRRLDARMLRSEIGSWDPASSRFLVIGTGSMEGAAWSWLGILGFEEEAPRATRAGATSRPAPRAGASGRARRAAPARPRRPAATGSIGTWVVWCRPCRGAPRAAARHGAAGRPAEPRRGLLQARRQEPRDQDVCDWAEARRPASPCSLRACAPRPRARARAPSPFVRPPGPDRGAVGGRAGGELLAALFRTIKHDEAGGERAENVREAVMFALHEVLMKNDAVCAKVADLRDQVETLTDRCTEHFTRHIVKSQASRVIERRLVKSAENLTKVVRAWRQKFECFGSSDKLRMTHKILRQLGKEADKLEGERTRPEKRKADEAKAPERKSPRRSRQRPLIPVPRTCWRARRPATAARRRAGPDARVHRRAAAGGGEAARLGRRRPAPAVGRAGRRFDACRLVGDCCTWLRHPRHTVAVAFFFLHHFLKARLERAAPRRRPRPPRSTPSNGPRRPSRT